MEKVSAAFLKLVDYAQRSQQYSMGLPQQTEAKQTWSGVGFSLGGIQYVVPMGEISEILGVPRYTQVPGVQSWVKGVANVRGRLLPVLDLLSFFKKTITKQIKNRRMLVVDHGGVYSGLIVDEVLGMQHFPVDSYTEDVNELIDSELPYVSGGYQRNGEIWVVFSFFRLADDPAFMNVAS